MAFRLNLRPKFIHKDIHVNIGKVFRNLVKMPGRHGASLASDSGMSQSQGFGGGFGGGGGTFDQTGFGLTQDFQGTGFQEGVMPWDYSTQFQTSPMPSPRVISQPSQTQPDNTWETLAAGALELGAFLL